jgi:hypothetical protein
MCATANFPLISFSPGCGHTEAYKSVKLDCIWYECGRDIFHVLLVVKYFLFAFMSC